VADNLVVREQFNKQAANFNNWPVTQDERNHRFLYDFFDLEAADRLLDIACGTGAFSVYAGRRIRAVWGVDISEKMIEIAAECAARNGLNNVSFLRCGVEKLPFADGSFECVVSKSAFHHLKDGEAVFKEMARCCKTQGRIGLQDIVLYGDKKLDAFFEELERDIDLSHNLSLSKQEMIDFYKGNGIKVTRLFESVSELNFAEYVNHAVQTSEAKAKIEKMLDFGLRDADISRWLEVRNGVCFWKRKVLTIAGEKLE
jgi:ubiquinone/menaquinone biosynthesis C-methylase UbiE